MRAGRAYDFEQLSGREVHVLVRARCKADIWNLYRKFRDKYEITRPTADEGRDYRWRVSMKRMDWSRILAKLGSEIDYSNFKNAVGECPDQSNKHSAYLSIWSAMLRVQHLESPTGKPKQRALFDWPEQISREADLLAEYSRRFDDPPPEPNKTIKSVTLGDE